VGVPLRVVPKRARPRVLLQPREWRVPLPAQPPPPLLPGRGVPLLAQPLLSPERRVLPRVRPERAWPPLGRPALLPRPWALRVQPAPQPWALRAPLVPRLWALRAPLVRPSAPPERAWVLPQAAAWLLALVRVRPTSLELRRPLH